MPLDSTLSYRTTAYGHLSSMELASRVHASGVRKRRLLYIRFRRKPYDLTLNPGLPMAPIAYGSYHDHHMQDSQPKCAKSVNRGFTLIEFLVVAAAVALLASLVLPAIQYARESARRLKCLNNEKQLSLGMISYHDAWQNFPPGYLGVVQDSTRPRLRTGSNSGHLLFTLRFLELEAIATQLDSGSTSPFRYHDSHWHSSEYAGIVQSHRISTFECPSYSFASVRSRISSFEPYGSSTIFSIVSDSANDALTCYLGNGGLHGKQNRTSPWELGVFFVNSKTRYSDIIDGSSNTLLLGETRGGGDPMPPQHLPTSAHYPASSPANLKDGVWVAGEPGTGTAYGADRYGSFHPGGVVNVAFADGSVKSIGSNVDVEVVQRISTIAGRK